MVVMQKAKSMLSLHHGRKMGRYRSALFRREEEEGGTPGEREREKEEGKDKGKKEEGENSNGKSK